MLILAMHYAASGVPWSSALVIGLLVGSGATALVFVTWMLAWGDRTLIMPSVAFKPVIAFSALTQFLLWSTVIIHTYFLPIYFQAIQGKRAVASGIDVFPYIIPAMLASLLAGAFVSKTGCFAQPCQVGCGIATIGSGLLYTLGTRSLTGAWVGFEILTGFSIGLATQQGFMAVQAVLLSGEIPIGTALINLSINLGGAVFVSVGNALLLDTLREGHVADVDVEQIIEAGATVFMSIVPQSSLKLIIQAYNDASRRVFLAATILMGLAFLSSFGMGWKKMTRREITDASGSQN